MNVSINKPDLEKFIRELVQSGAYGSAEEVIEAGLARLMLDPANDELTDDEWVAIREGDEQIERGEGIPADAAFAELRRKYTGK